MPREHVPYSREGLERLAAALRVDSAYLWVSPNTNELSFRDSMSSQIKGQSGEQAISEEEECEVEN